MVFAFVIFVMLMAFTFSQGFFFFFLPVFLPNSSHSVLLSGYCCIPCLGNIIRLCLVQLVHPPFILRGFPISNVLGFWAFSQSGFFQPLVSSDSNVFTSNFAISYEHSINILEVQFLSCRNWCVQCDLTFIFLKLLKLSALKAVVVWHPNCVWYSKKKGKSQHIPPFFFIHLSCRL